MRIDTARLELLLKYAGLIKTSKPYVDPIKLFFTEEGLWIKQSDDSKTLAIVGFFSKEFFSEYDYTGEVIIPVKSTYNIIRKAMRDSAEVKIEFTEDKYIISGKSTTLKDSLVTADVYVIDDVKIIDYKDLLIGESFKPIVGYMTVDYSVLAEMECDSDITFNLTKNGLAIKCSFVTAEIERKPPVIMEEYKEDVSVKVDRTILEQIVKSTKTTLKMALTKPGGEAGPVILGLKSDLFKISYWIAPKVTE